MFGGTRFAASACLERRALPRSLDSGTRLCLGTRTVLGPTGLRFRYMSPPPTGLRFRYMLLRVPSIFVSGSSESGKKKPPAEAGGWNNQSEDLELGEYTERDQAVARIIFISITVKVSFDDIVAAV
jgi:hypothetical protein